MQQRKIRRAERSSQAARDVFDRRNAEAKAAIDGNDAERAERAMFALDVATDEHTRRVNTLVAEVERFRILLIRHWESLG